MLCSGYGAAVLVGPLEALTAPLASPDGTGAQAIVVLGSGRVRDAPEYEGRDIPDPVGLVRLRYAARLQHQTGLPVLVTGGNPRHDQGRASEAEGMARALADEFATPVRWKEGRSANTWENALYSAELLRPAGVTRILLVTDAMHMPRARRAFAATGLEVVAAPTMFLGRRSGPMFGLLPGAESLRRSRYALHEWVGLLWYRLRYGA